MNQVNKDEISLNAQRRQAMADTLKSGFDQAKSDPLAAAQVLASNPDTAQYGQLLFKESIERQRPVQPAAEVQLLEYFKQHPEDMDAYQKLKSMGQKPETPYFTALPTSTGYVTFNNRTGKYEAASVPGMTNTPLPIPADVPLAKDKAAATAQGTTEGGAAGAAKTQYGTYSAMADELDRDIGRLKGAPGLKSIVGLRGSIPNIPGTDAADAQAQLEKLTGSSFLQARQLLKGGGAITDYEGSRAEEAVGRMQKAQSKESFLQALDDYKLHIERGLELLNKQQSGDFTALPHLSGQDSSSNKRPPLSSFGGKQ